MKHLFIILAVLLFASCTQMQSAPSVVIPPQPVSALSLPPKIASASNESAVATLSAASLCARTSFKSVGRPPKGYIEGMGIAYHRAVCSGAKARPLGAKSVDALAYYGLAATMRNTYGLLIGLGMRESAGKYCCGRDPSTNNKSADTAEAGAFQTSYNSHSADPKLTAIFQKYQHVGAPTCLADVFSTGVVCSQANWTSYGTGDGLVFQDLEKKCPAFTTEYAATAVRVIRAHWGTINRKEAQVVQPCLDMLAQVEKISCD